MNNKFEELAKGMAQSVTRRGALKKFGVGLVSMALASFGLENKARADRKCLPSGAVCHNDKQCCSGNCVKIGFGYKPKYGGCG